MSTYGILCFPKIVIPIYIPSHIFFWQCDMDTPSERGETGGPVQRPWPREYCGSGSLCLLRLITQGIASSTLAFRIPHYKEDESPWSFMWKELKDLSKQPHQWPSHVIEPLWNNSPVPIRPSYNYCFHEHLITILWGPCPSPPNETCLAEAFQKSQHSEFVNTINAVWSHEFWEVCYVVIIIRILLIPPIPFND